MVTAADAKAEPAANAQPILLRQHHIEHNQVKSLRLQQGKHAGAVPGRGDTVAVLPEESGQQCQNLLIIIDKQQTWHGIHPRVLAREHIRIMTVRAHNVSGL